MYHLYFFRDLRTSKLVGGYWESHNGDVTQVAFHDQHPTTIATGSTDGLINIFDISQNDEDDALLTTLNTESSVVSIRSNYDQGSPFSVTKLTSNRSG